MLPNNKRYGLNKMLLSMPCSQGSVARAIDGKRYILNGKNEWKYSYSVGSGNGGTIADVESIPQSMIETLFG